MRFAAIVLLAACGHGAATPAPRSHAARLLPPLPIDPAAPGATYLTTVALQLQPGWGQFLDDCRLRLPASHALNQMALAAIAELVVDTHGRVVDVQLATSGNSDFDRAVRDAISDAAPLAAPPQALLSDDDRLHVRWLFARDRRQVRGHGNQRMVLQVRSDTGTVGDDADAVPDQMPAWPDAGEHVAQA